MQKQAPSHRQDPGRGRLRAVVLRPAALPLGRLRRPDAARSRRATGSPPTSPRRRRSRSSPTCGSAASRSARSRRSSCPPEERSTARTRPGDDRDRARVRADLRGRAGDPAPEDAARRDLRRADLRAPRPRRRAARAGLARRQRRTTPTPRRRGRGDPRGRRTSASTQVEDATQIDEIFNALDEETRESFQRWQANAAVAIQGRGLDLNDALRQPRPVPHRRLRRARDRCDRQKVALKGLVRDTGTVFEALTERDQELAGVITGSNETFDALASAGAGARRDLPDLARPSSARRALTLDAPRRVPADNTRPLVQDLIPVAARHQPDAAQRPRALARTSRACSSTSTPADPSVAQTGLPALRAVLDGLAPAARPPRPVPRQPEPGDPLPRLLPPHGHRLPRRPAGAASRRR